MERKMRKPQWAPPAPTRVENSTRPLFFTSALGCRASENFDFSSELFFPTIYANTFLMRGKSYFKIFQGLTNKALFIHFCLFPWSVDVLM